MPILFALLYLLLYTLVGVLVIELILWILALIFTVPPRLRQILYAILGVCLLIYLTQLLAGGTLLHLPR